MAAQSRNRLRLSERLECSAPRSRPPTSLIITQLRVEEGSLYPAHRRMETSGLIKAEWKRSENNRRARYHRLTTKGVKRLAKEVQSWEQHTAAVAAFLKFA
jgi:DNA-binding PadR family transcriptional regulator